MRLSFATVGLAVLDALPDIDAACLFVFEDERPLRGIAGYLDWRLCGHISRLAMEGRLLGESGEALLFPVRGQASLKRVFCFGAGRRLAFTREALQRLARKACRALGDARAKGFVAEAPAVEGADELESARVFASEGAALFRGERIVLLGDGPALARVFKSASPIAGVQFDREPLATGDKAPARRAARAG